MAKPRPRQIFQSVGFGVVSFIIAFSLGTVLTLSTGVPLAGGLLNGVLTAMVLTIGLKSTRFFGSASLMWLVFSGLAIMTTTLGPPGVYKVVVGLVAGLLWDAFYAGFKYKRWALYVGGLVGSLSIMLTLIGALSLGFGVNAEQALERYMGAIVVLLVINVTVTAIGIWLGDYLHRTRLSELQAFKNVKVDDK